MRRSRERTLSVAFHEAGHAVIGYPVGQRLGWRPYYVHIIPDGHVEGASKFARLT
jgi:ATP-dependent Zn protease